MIPVSAYDFDTRHPSHDKCYRILAFLACDFLSLLQLRYTTERVHGFFVLAHGASGDFHFFFLGSYLDFLFYGKRSVAAWGFRQAFFFPNSGAGAFGSISTSSRIGPPHHGLSSDLSIASILHWALSHCYVFKAFLSGGTELCIIALFTSSLFPICVLLT